MATFILVLALWTISCVQAADDPFAIAQNPCSQIRNAQYVCIDCMTVGFCSQMNGIWHTSIVGTCSGAYFFCNDQVNGCTYSQQCELEYRGPKFECQNPGIYPDPYNCKYYHECNARNELTTSVCNNGLGYSLETGKCSLSKNSAECKERQYKCERPGQIGLWPSDDNIFYICMPHTTGGQIVYYPLLYRCPAGEIFMEYQCEPKDGSALGEIPNGSVPSSTTIAPVTIAPEIPDVTTCRQGTLIADPLNCRAYYRCGNTQQYECPSGTYFDATKQRCVMGNC